MAKYVATGRSSGAPREQWFCSYTECDEPVFQPQAHYHLCAKHLAALLKLAGVRGRGPEVTAEEASARLKAVITGKGQAVGEVYYALVAPGRVKIGFSTNTRARMGALRTTAPELELLATEVGTVGLERRRHRQFGHLRIDPKREVFRLEDDLAAWIDVVRLAEVA